MSDEQPRLHGVELRYSSVSVFDQPNTQSRELRCLHQGEQFEVLSKEPV